MTIYQKLSLIQKEFKSKKSRYNSFGKYNFRSAEDILEALKPYNEKYKVYFVVHEQFQMSNLTVPVIETRAQIHDTESEAFISATAIVGVDLNQKGMQTPQQFGSASSYGKKYALGNLLLIDDTADSDATNTHGASATTMTSAQLKQAQEYVKSGGKVAQIKKKYTMTPEQEKSLIYDENKYQEQPKFLPEDKIIPLEEIIKSLTNIGGDVYGLMHSWFQDSIEGLKIIKKNWDGPIMFYPEIHKFDTNTHEAIVTTTENEFVKSFEELIDDQIKIIGGCCGVNDKHLKKLIKRYS